MALSLITVRDVYYAGVLQEIKKSSDPLCPIFEAFTNALESLKLHPEEMPRGLITVRLYMASGTVEGGRAFEKLEIEDNGVGLDEENFGRLRTLRDNRKGFRNKGSGRIQFLHFFGEARYESWFRRGDEFSRRTVVLSKRWLPQKNAIMQHEGPYPCDCPEPRTVLMLKSLLKKTDRSTYDNLTATVLKQSLIERYLLEFCSRREALPGMQVEEYVDGKRVAKELIRSRDVPAADKTTSMTVAYRHLAADSSDLVPTGKTAKLEFSSFRIPADKLDRNAIKLTSKGEIAGKPKVPLHSLKGEDALNGFRYLFLVSGEYLNGLDGDTRGALGIATKKEFLKNRAQETPELFDSGAQVFLDDIQSEANRSVLELHDEIKEAVEEKKGEVESLKEMFLLSEETLDSLSISFGDSEETILRKVYEADAKAIAKRDAEIKANMERIQSLDPTSGQYRERLMEICSDVVKAVPIQNRNALTHYVARRKLVLKVLDSILRGELDVQGTSARNIDERLLHNLIFRQSSDEPEDSDLWLISEDFIYFKGTSETELCEAMIDGRKLFMEEFADEEEEYLKSLGENRKLKRPDVLLFPNEGKCIIIEFKNPDVNVSDHLTQINKYAYLIRNFSVADLELETFYGYLIGQKISPRDIRAADGDFIHAYSFDYLFRPAKTVPGENGRRDGSLYTEVIKYSTLLARAAMRNEIYIEKLTKNREPQA